MITDKVNVVDESERRAPLLKSLGWWKWDEGTPFKSVDRLRYLGFFTYRGAKAMVPYYNIFYK